MGVVYLAGVNGQEETCKTMNDVIETNTVDNNKIYKKFIKIWILSESILYGDSVSSLVLFRLVVVSGKGAGLTAGV